MKKLKQIPRFRSEAEEQKFWDTHDLTDYFDMSRAQRVSFPNLKLSTETISLRLTASLLAQIKQLANKHDVPYQSFMKIMLARQVKIEQAT